LASSPPTERGGPAGQLQELREQLCEGNPDLYRQLALYLQVLRQVLPVRVERACFHLAVQVQPSRYPALPAHDRRLLHRRLSTLVRRCTSLLTVEQLASLAAQIARERQRQERREHQQWLRQFSPPSAASAGPPAGAIPVPPSVDPLPEGSVNLDGSRPFSAGLLRALGGLAGPPGPREASGSVELADNLGESEEPGAGEGEEEGEETSSFGDLPPLLQRLMVESRSAGDRQDGVAADLWSGGQLPVDPLSLLNWLDGIEAALSRRLRNLSHAINVELLRAGLSGNLLPVSLLDAVLAGQLEPQPAPPNLLRLRLPFPADDASPLQVMAVLLRSVDLELEEPRLRTCRRRLQQHRQEVRRMAQQFQRLQRRREAHEAEQLWLRDRHESLSPPD
jgi:hypothetical protein